MRRYTKPYARYVLQYLQSLYPEAHCELNYSNPFELLVATVLSAQCTDVRVNMVTDTLFQKYRSPADYVAVSPEELEQDVRPTGFYRSKANSIQTLSRRLLEHYDSQVPDTMEDLLTLRGVARKTANVVLWNAFGKNEGVVVDTHVKRISQRLGLTRHSDVKYIEKDLMRLFPQNEWGMLSHYLIWHGRRLCKARKPNCDECPLREQCLYGG